MNKVEVNTDISVVVSLSVVVALGLSIVIPWLPLQIFGLIITASLAGLIIKNALS